MSPTISSKAGVKCNKYTFEDLVDEIKQGKRAPLRNDNITIVGTDIPVTSNFSASISDMDPLNLRGSDPEFSRPGAILLLLSAHFLKTGKGLFKRNAAHLIRGLAARFYKLDWPQRSKYDLLLFYYPDVTPPLMATLNETIQEEIGGVNVIWHPYPAYDRNYGFPFAELEEHFGRLPGYLTTCGPPKKRHWSKDYLLMTVFRVFIMFQV